MAELARGRLGGRGRPVRPGPASGLIWSRERARKLSARAGGGKARNAFQLTLTYETDCAFDLDMRRIIAHVSLGLAEHFRDALEQGARPDGFGRQPSVAKRTREIDLRTGEHFGTRSGFMADHWYLGPVRGGALSATRLLKPYGGAAGPKPSIPKGELGRDFLLNILLKRGIDFQSVRGSAQAVIQRVFDHAVHGSFGVLTLPEQFESREGLLPEFQQFGNVNVRRTS